MITDNNRYYDQDDLNSTTNKHSHRESCEDENKIQQLNTDINKFLSAAPDSDSNGDSDYTDNEFSNELENDDQSNLEHNYNQSQNDLEQDDLSEEELEDDNLDNDEDIEPETFADDAQKID